MELWWGWDAIIDIWMRRDMPWMEVRHDLDGGEACILGPWWNLGTWMEVRRYMDVGETRILGPGWRWERTWKHLTSTFWDLGSRVWGDLKTACLGFNYHDLDWGETWPGLWWGVNIGTWMDVARVKVRCEYLYLGGIQMVRRKGWLKIILGIKCRWRRTWMEVRYKSLHLNGGEMVHR